MMIQTGHWTWRPAEVEQQLIELALSDIRTPAVIFQSCADSIHDGLLAYRLLGSAPSDAVPSPSDIDAGLRQVVEGAQSIAEGLAKLRYAWRATDSTSVDRLQSLDHLHRALLGTLAVGGLPPKIAVRIPLDELERLMPAVHAFGFENDWTPHWQRLAGDLAAVASAFERSDFARISRPLPDRSAILIQNLGSIYNLATGKRPAASAPKGNAPAGWQGPFVRFVGQLWPLTNDPLSPSRATIARALKARRTNHPAEQG